MGFTGETDLVLAIKDVVKNDKDLQRAIKGLDGANVKGDPGPGYTATSPSTVAISIGSKTFATQSGLAYTIGARVKITSIADTANFMSGIVTDYSDNNLTVNVDAVGGSGTLANWTINLSGERGATGATGSTIQPFGGSIVKNSAVESGTTEGWTLGSIGVDYEGMPTFEYTSTTINQNAFLVDINSLYKVSGKMKTSGSGSYWVVLYRLDKIGEIISQGGDAALASLNTVTTNNSAFESKTFYFGGKGTGSLSFGTNCVKSKVYLGGANGGIVSVSKLIVEKVSLGEHVPYNLSFLPKWQSVYDPTTGDTGLFNGTSVVWNLHSLT